MATVRTDRNDRRRTLLSWHVCAWLLPIASAESRLAQVVSRHFQSSLQNWIAKDSNNILKRQEYAVSGRLLRTCYFPKWKKIYCESKRSDV